MLCRYANRLANRYANMEPVEEPPVETSSSTLAPTRHASRESREAPCVDVTLIEAVSALADSKPGDVISTSPAEASILKTESVD
jgi:hypothetical protein